MNKKIKLFVTAILSFALLFTGCSAPAVKIDAKEDKLNIVATTTMLADLSKVIGGNRVKVDGLMGAGIDPHLYQASAGDVSLMHKADVVVYNGLHLEGKMGEIFENLSSQGSFVICIEDGIDKSKLLVSEDNSSVHDPHIWFDVSLWKDAAQTVAKGLSQADPEGKSYYEANLDTYIKELDKTNAYILERANELSKENRVLVTAHDAFQYFGKAYGFEVYGLQGISTDAEAGTADVSELANFIAKRQVKAIFVESSVPPKTIEALQAAVKAKGFNVSIGGELYSDSLGDAASKADTYILTVKANIDTIVDALK